jgi:hypothetical protein
MGKWLAGILASIIAGLVLYLIRDYHAPGVSVQFAVHHDANDAPTELWVSVTNKGDQHLHECYITANQQIAGQGDYTAALNDQVIPNVELGPYENKAFTFPIKVNAKYYMQINGFGSARCVYYNPFGQEKRFENFSPGPP